MDSLPNTIAIDGPAGSGKSTVGKLLADRLGYLFFDTGAIYRALTLLALERGISAQDGPALARLAAGMDVDILPPDPATLDDRGYTVVAEGRDITWALRNPTIDVHVSPVAVHPEVRELLIEQQRRIGRRGRVVMVGRDIGTVIMPDADLKIYLDATVEVRAQRRCAERLGLGQPCDEAALVQELRERDLRDSSRASAPLRRADDAILFDTSHLSIEEVVEALLDRVEG